MPLVLRCQSWDEIVRLKSVYLSGEGFGESVQEAREQALADLIGKISIVVKKDVVVTEDERVSNGTFDANSYVEAKVKTFSTATLTNTDEIIITNEPDAHVGIYIKRSELGKIFESRKNKINEYIRLAQNALTKEKVDDALRYYYWAFTLLKTLQHPDEVRDSQSHLLTAWIPSQMDAIFDDIQVEAVGHDGANYDLRFTFRGKPVASLDYTYFDGRTWTSIFSAKNGRGVLELIPGMEASAVKMKYEYAYRGQSMVDKEVSDVLEVVKGKAMRKSYATVDLDKTKTQPPMVQPIASPASELLSASTGSIETLSAAQAAPAQKVVDAVVAAFRSGKIASVRHHFTPEAAVMLDSLLHYGKPRVLDYHGCSFTRFGKGLVARSVPMSFTFARGARRSFVEDVVFTFDEDNRISNITFALDQKATDDILARSAYSPLARQTIISFLETYKTAYAMRRLDYIKSIFDDNAIIIVGHVVRRLERTDNDHMRFANNRYVKRTQLTKAQYIKNLEACFRRNEFINIRFSNNDVTKAGGKAGETYGIQIKQDYYSSTYGDSGYLYLQVDLNNPDTPIIKVRVWQDEPDPELHRAYGIQDFN